MEYTRTVAAIAGVVIVGAAVLMRAAAEPAQPAAGATLFTGARLITDGDRPPIEDSSFVVEGDRITAVGRRAEITAPAGARRVDLSGKTVMPAIVNAHVHVGFQNDASFAAANYTRESIVGQLRQYAYYGVAAVLTAGTDAGEVAYQIRDTPVPGAALLRTSGRGFAAPNAGPAGAAMRASAYGVSTEDEARRYVRELAARRPDFVKIWVDDRNGSVVKLAAHLYRAIIDEAHAQGLRVAAHVYYLADARDLVDAGVDGFLHSVRDAELDEELVARMKARNVFITPNLAIGGRGAAAQSPPWFDDPLLAEVFSAAVIARPRTAAQNQATAAAAGRGRTSAGPTSYEMQIRSLAKLNAAGVTIALGDDSGIENSFPGYAALRQLERMAEGGMTPQQVIVAATRTPAALLRLTDLGSIAPGKSASFIVLDANPLDSLANARRISTVYLRGQEVDRAAIRAARP